MKIKIASIFLLLTSICFAQDTIRTFRQKRFLTRITAISKDSVTFKNFSNPESRTYSLPKNEISEIKYHDGTVVDFLSEEEKMKSTEDFKNHLVSMINQYGFDSDSSTKRFHASFEGDNLRLQVKNAKGTKMTPGLLYNFAKVYDVHDLSEHTKNTAFINIWVNALVKPKTNKWEKQKIVMKVKGHDNAVDILRSLKILNKRMRENAKI